MCTSQRTVHRQLQDLLREAPSRCCLRPLDLYCTAYVRKDDSNYKATCGTRHSEVKHEIEGTQINNVLFQMQQL